MSYLPPAMQVLLVLLVVAGGVFDIRTRRIPNWLTVSGLVLGIGLNVFLFETPGLWLSLEGVGLALLIYFPLYVLRAMGAGDVKLMGAVGGIVGPWNWLGIFILTALLGGVFAVLLLLSKGGMVKALKNVGYIVSEIAHMRLPYWRKAELDVSSPRAVTLPHGAVIGLGCMAFLAAAAMWAPR